MLRRCIHYRRPTRYHPMIIYGTNGAHMRTTPLPGVACPGCTASNTLQLSVFSRYVHLYWVPLFPLNKPTVARCGHCQQTWEGKAISAELRAPALALKQATRIPLWHWSGVAAVVTFMGWGALESTRSNREGTAYLAQPQVGDIYTVRATDDDPNYSLLKVVAVKGPTVDVVPNDYQIDNSHPIEALNAPANYNKESFPLTQFELQIMRNKGQLTDVDRLAK